MFRASGSAGEVTGGGGGLSSREITEEQAFYDLTFKHFKESKVEISSAITKSYPFLEILRDRDFISEQKYKLLRKKCENLVQMNRVIYDFLSDLEKVFSQSLLRVMFSQRNLKEYPGLMKILRSFPVEAQQKISTQPSHEQDHRGDSLEVWGGASHDTLKSPPRSIP
ncbi:nuclear body protein SP140-like protein, partial [Nannospalax galili]|uniref:nuclear body protein SP140-like protein n=1 Tax=Nannospalax galili TaxID=1026970 RepID=UPI000819AB23